MSQFCCSNSVGVATGVGHSLWVGLDVHRLQKFMAFCWRILVNVHLGLLFLEQYKSRAPLEILRKISLVTLGKKLALQSNFHMFAEEFARGACQPMKSL